MLEDSDVSLINKVGLRFGSIPGESWYSFAEARSSPDAIEAIIVSLLSTDS